MTAAEFALMRATEYLVEWAEKALETNRTPARLRAARCVARAMRALYIFEGSEEMRHLQRSLNVKLLNAIDRKGNT